MKDLSARSPSSVNSSVAELNTDSPQAEANLLLPRSAWNSQVAFLKILFKVKRALDKIEQEAS